MEGSEAERDGCGGRRTGEAASVLMNVETKWTRVVSLLRRRTAAELIELRARFSGSVYPLIYF